jgi:tRNA(Ile)-lysidine synthase
MARFAPFEQRPIIAVAVSGGIDSMALVQLAHTWAKTRQGRIIALTVDHGLRSESAAEAQKVAHLCTERGIEHHTLHWHTPALSSAVQMQARNARYDLLTDWCSRNHVMHLMTAHHQDDQAETLFFRLARGSGISGLACMPAITYYPSLRLLRPLLAIAKARLQATLTDSDTPWVEDPSNQSTYYTRNVIRRNLSGVSYPTDLPGTASSLAMRFGVIRSHMEKAQASCATKCMHVFPEGYATLALCAFSQLAPEYRLRLLSGLVQTIAGQEYAIRSGKLELLHSQLLSKTPLQKRTLAGLQFVPVTADIVLICREPRAAQPPILLIPHQPVLWDGRFELSHNHAQPLQISMLGAAGARIIKNLRPHLPWLPERQVLNVLPVLWDLEELVCVPHINYRHPDYRHTTCKIRFTPAKALAGNAFSGMNKQPITIRNSGRNSGA